MRSSTLYLILIVTFMELWSGLSSAASPSSALAYVAGSTQKVCQLTGDFDRALGQPTRSQTGQRWGVMGTDLGSSFEHRGKLFFLFGDTWGRPGLRDALAWTSSHEPDTINLNFYRAEDGKWLPLAVPGVSLGAFEVPSGGVSIGGKMYVVFTTDWAPEKYLMGRSVLAVSEDDGKSFKALYDLSNSKFINVSFWSSKGWLYIFGSGPYRRSSVYLARIKLNQIATRSALCYWHGNGPQQWPRQEQEAVPLFQHDVVGEFSVTYSQPVKRYIMLYNSGNPRGIIMRSAGTPWGPWSAGTIIFDPWRDHGYGQFMHIASNFKAGLNDTVNDPQRENEWGGEYGPYLMARFTTGNRNQCRIFYTMSTWNPYQVVIMRTDLKFEAQRSSVPALN